MLLGVDLAFERGIHYSAMKRTLSISLLTALLLFATASAYAAVTFRAFNLKNLGGRVEVSWTTTREQDCTEFTVERSVDGIEFFPIATGISPHGTNQEYRYIDSSIYKDKSTTFYYRVVGKTSSGTNTYTGTEEILVDSNGFQRTWGGLKAMFR